MKVAQPADCRTCRYKCNINFTDKRTYGKPGDYARRKDFILSNMERFDVPRQRARGERKRT